jgi:hypothetical protein
LSKENKMHLLPPPFQTLSFFHFFVHFERLKKLWMHQLEFYKTFLNFIHNVQRS